MHKGKQDENSHEQRRNQRKISPLISKLNIELGRNSPAIIFEALNYFRDLETKKIGAKVFRELQNVLLEENGGDKMAGKVTNEEVLECAEERRTLLNNILR